MGDEIRKLGDTLVQHGPRNDRVYAMKVPRSDVPEVLDEIEELAREEGYGKLVAKAHGDDFGEFAARGYEAEAMVPGFFGPEEPGVFMGKFLDEDRAEPEDPGRLQRVLEAAWSAADADPEPPVGDFELREAESVDAEAIAEIYREVFVTYPFAIHDPAHLRAEMGLGTRYFTAWEGKTLVAASSMEPGGADGAVEMTDFATHPAYRGQGLATRLLGIMERCAREGGIRLAYTIARARSFGMNITFGRRGYRYRGRLVNNTQIAGSIESMNVWSKRLAVPLSDHPLPAAARTALSEARAAS